MADQTTIVLTKLEVDASQAIAETTKLDAAQKKTNETMDEATKSTTDYSGALDGLVDGIGVLPGKTGAAVKGIMGMTKGMQGLKVAIIATGIGALIVALGALFTWFNRTAEGQEAMRRGLAVLGQITNVLMDAFAKLGEWMYKAFQDPKTAIKELWEMIKTNLINRVTGLADMFGALGRVIKAAFTMDLEALKTGLAEVGTALIQVTTGLDAEQQVAALKAIKQGWDDVAESIRKADEIQRRKNKLTRDEIDDLTKHARLLTKVAEQRLKAANTESTIAERLKASEEAIAAIGKYYDDQVARQKERIAIMKEEQALSNNTLEDNRELAELEAALINLEKQRNDQLREVTGQKNALLKAEQDAAKKAEADLIAQGEKIKEALLNRLNAERDHQNKMLELTAERVKKQEELDEKAREKKAAEDQRAYERKKELDEQATMDSLALLSYFGTKHKAFLIASIIANTATGITKTIANLGFPWAIPGIALTAATGIEQLVKVRKEQFARGGFLYGNPHSRGGVDINAEGGEAIINKRSMANPFLRKLASDINVAGGGVAFAQNGMLVGQMQMASSISNLSRDLQQSMAKTSTVLVLEDFHNVNNRVTVRENMATLR